MFRKTAKKKWLSRLLLVAMIVMLLPAPAWADETPSDGGGITVETTDNTDLDTTATPNGSGPNTPSTGETPEGTTNTDNTAGTDIPPASDSSDTNTNTLPEPNDPPVDNRLLMAAPTHFMLMAGTLPPEVADALIWQEATLANPFGSAKDYNIFLLDGNLTNFHESEGPVAVNGNVDCANHWTGHSVGGAMGGYHEKAIIGALINGNITNSQSYQLEIRAGHFVTTNAQNNPYISLYPVTGLPEKQSYTINQNMADLFFTSAASDLYNMNQQLLAMPANGSAVFANNEITLVGDVNSQTQVFNITTDQLKDTISVNLDETTQQAGAIIVNVKAKSTIDDFYLPFRVETGVHNSSIALCPYAHKIIFNVDPQIKNVHLANSSYLQGSLMAPNANVIAHDDGSSVNGHLIAKSFNGNGTRFECHWIPWDGTIEKPVVPSYPELTITKNVELAQGTTIKPQSEASFDFQVMDAADSATIYGTATVTVPADKDTATAVVNWNKAVLEAAFKDSTDPISLILKEVADENEHWQYDSMEYTFTLTKDGIDYEISESTPLPDLVFINKYVNEPVSIPVNKRIVKPTDAAYETLPKSAADSTFAIQLLDGTAEVASVQLSAATDWAGSFSIEKPSVSKTYTLHEVAPDPIPAGWQYAKDITVTVDKTGAITYGDSDTLLGANESIVITNLYNSADLTVTKKLVNAPAGTNLSALDFTFGLFTADADEPIRTAVVEAGTASDTMQALFTDIPAPLNADDTFTYTIKELSDDPITGWQYDDTVYTITVASNGEITWNEAYGKELTFTNVHKATVSLTKEVQAQGLNAALPEDFTFTFTLTPQDGTPGDKQSLTLAKTKEAASFKKIGFFTDLPVPSNGEEHTYLLSEVKGNVPGWQYDDTVYTITIDSQGQVTYAKAGTTADGAVFTNTYKTPTEITMKKVMRYQHNGVWAPIPKGDYTFTFTLYSDEALTETVGVAQATVSSNGSQDKISAPLSFLPDADFAILADGVYYIQENPLTDSHWLANEQIYRITVENNLVTAYAAKEASGTYTSVDPADAVFTNIYEASSTDPGPQPDPDPTPGPNPTPTPTPTPTPVNITEPNVPLAPLPIINEPTAVDVPAEVEIAENPVPLSDNPKTGAADNTLRYLLIALLCIAVAGTFWQKEER